MSAEPFPSWSALVAVYQAVLHDVVAALATEAGMDSGVFSALAYLARAEPAHRLPMADLQRALHPRYSQPGFSRLVQRMETDGIVQRRIDPSDRRAAVVVMTRRGRAQFARANRVYVNTLRAAYGRHLRGAEHALLVETLDALASRRAADAAR